MPKRLFCLFPLLAALAACSSNGSSQRVAAAAGTPPPAAAEQLPIPLGSPVFIDSSAYVMYPLALQETEIENEDSYGSKYSSRTATYWNILFHNLKSGQSHLLGTQKMVINSYAGQEASGSTRTVSEGYPRIQATDELLYFSVTTADFDHDGQLTAVDPAYLFVSDKTGANFRQVSPDSLHVAGWDVRENMGKILLQTVRDSNHDRKFGEGDENIPYVYDLATQQPARRLFSPAFMQQLRQQFRQQWPKKP